MPKYECSIHENKGAISNIVVNPNTSIYNDTNPNWGIPQSTRWRIIPGNTTNWKYRGQITKNTDQVTIEIHIKKIITGNNGWQIIADGHLWKGKIRIYQIDNIALETY